MRLDTLSPKAKMELPRGAKVVAQKKFPKCLIPRTEIKIPLPAPRVKQAVGINGSQGNTITTSSQALVGILSRPEESTTTNSKPGPFKSTLGPVFKSGLAPKTRQIFQSILASAKFKPESDVSDGWPVIAA
jgi:hypothetical protein